ncbi:MAG: cyclophilin-like fold protein [Syntrophorhabdaceae bacterium]|nr:cyclophilin-like fold protein [Syntrophorhabdaceae bacterium]MDD4196775.1 cyclophilin-like fold protein [Syntrophorhabdaceae bacterium]
MKIRIITGKVTVEAELFDTRCAQAIAKILPINASPNEWGDEFYFSVDVKASLDETATRSVKTGDIGYWPPGNAIAIFFGPTPLSHGPDPVPASAVNLVGRTMDDATVLRRARGASTIRIEAA